MIVSAILINILNPKLSIFFFAFLPQFVSADEASPLPRMLELSGVFMLHDLRGLRRSTACSPPRSATTSSRARAC